MTPRIRMLTCALPLLLLAACGGGGDAPTTGTAPVVPASATASPEAFTRFVGSLAADDQGEPLAVDQLVPPTSESAEPSVVG